MATSINFNPEVAKSFGLLFLVGYSTYRTLPVFAGIGALVAMAATADYFLQQAPADRMARGSLFSKATLSNLQLGGAAAFDNFADYANQRVAGLKTAP